MLQMGDGINADRNGTDYTKDTKTITRDERLTLRLAPGGGWVARIGKVEEQTKRK
jgi:alpha-glucosidase